VKIEPAMTQAIEKSAAINAILPNVWVYCKYAKSLTSMQKITTQTSTS
jgi:hypothetical protein